MVHSLRPVRLRQLTTVKKVFVQKSEIAQKKKKKEKIVFKYIIKNKKSFQMIKRQITSKYHEKNEQQKIDLDIG